VDYYLGLAYLAVQQPANAATSFRQALAQTSDEEVRAEIDRHLAALQGHAGEGTQP
jgi:predicted negative regulator of RcsB-dependent stress response